MDEHTYSETKDNIDELLEAFQKNAKIVTSTMGPYGQGVVVKTKNGAEITSDGITVLSYLRPSSPIEKAACLFMYDAGKKTELQDGDGTTTTTCLIAAMLEEYVSNKNDEVNPWQTKREMEEAVSEVSAKLTKEAKNTTQEALYSIAKTSANGDEVIAKLVSDLVWKGGPDSVVEVKKSSRKAHWSNFEKGYQFDRGPIVSEFLLGHKEVTVKNPLIFLTNDTIDDAKYYHDNLKDLHKAHSAKGQVRPLVIICQDAEGSMISTALANIDLLPIFLVHAPQTGIRRNAMMEDIKEITGTKYIFEKSKGLDFTTMEDASDFDMNSFGSCESLKIEENRIILYFNEKDKTYSKGVEARIKNIDIELEDDNMNEKLEKTPEYKDWLTKRKVALSTGIGTIYIKDGPETERFGTKRVLDDTILACKSALRTKVIPGANTLLYHISVNARVKTLGAKIIYKALAYPLKQIYKNAGLEKINVPKSPWMIPSFLGEEPQHAEDLQVLDSLGVAISCLINAEAIAAQIITSKYIILHR